MHESVPLGMMNKTDSKSLADSDPVRDPNTKPLRWMLEDEDTWLDGIWKLAEHNATIFEKATGRKLDSDETKRDIYLHGYEYGRRDGRENLKRRARAGDYPITRKRIENRGFDEGYDEGARITGRLLKLSFDLPIAYTMFAISILFFVVGLVAYRLYPL